MIKKYIKKFLIFFSNPILAISSISTQIKLFFGAIPDDHHPTRNKFIMTPKK